MHLRMLVHVCAFAFPLTASAWGFDPIETDFGWWPDELELEAQFDRPELMTSMYIENDGIYPIVSVLVDGVEVLRPNTFVAPGDYITYKTPLASQPTVKAQYGTSCPNYYVHYYGARCYEPLWNWTFQNVNPSLGIVVPEHTAHDSLPGGTFHGTYLDANLNWRDSYLTFYDNGTFDWSVSNGTQGRGTYTEGVPNEYGIYREVDVSILGQHDTITWLEYEQQVVVWIDGVAVPHGR